MVIIIKKIIISSFIFLFIYIIFYYINTNHYYKTLYEEKNTIIFEGPSAPRGRIYDASGNVLVDNILINNIVFYNIKNIDKLSVAKMLNNIITLDSPTDKEIIEYYKQNFNIYKLLSDEEIDLIKKRKLDKDIIINERILESLNNLTNEEKSLIKIYNLLISGYEYEPKIILSDISDELINKIISANIPGIKIESSYERYYPYNETLKNIFGSVGKIPYEQKDEYLNNGYYLSDTVGLSYLEKYYDKYLQGTKAVYKYENNNIKLLKEEKKGNDLYLSIDINLQIKVDEIIKNNLIKAKKYPNTDYLTDSYVIISSPKTGEIKAISGQRLLKEEQFNDIVINNISSSFTMGSVVKGATISVGYQNNLIDPNKKILDSCVKLKNQTEKCSWKELGYLNSVTALEQSSNYYQFLLAIKLAGKEYFPNMELNVTKKEFDIYRNMLSSYGLGIKTGIDLPNEKIGLIGEKTAPDLLLNLAIGQYDTYTPIELITYINTIGDYGKRRKPSLVRYIKNNDDIIYENKYEVVSNVDIKKEDMALIHKGFYYVMNRGTGNGFMSKKVKPAGKTGTSESFLDLDNDGIIDTSTLTLTLAGYFPYDDPTYSLVVICPNTSYKNSKHDYIYYLTSRISREITDFMFENMIFN